MDITEQLTKWIFEKDIRPRIDLREEEASYLCDDDYEGNGCLLIPVDCISDFLKHKNKKR